MQVCASCKDVARDNTSYVTLRFTWVVLRIWMKMWISLATVWFTPEDHRKISHTYTTTQMQVCASCKDVARDNASFVPAAPRWLGLLLLLQRPENAHGMPMRPFTLAFFSLKTIVHIRIFFFFFLFLLPQVTWTKKYVFVQKSYQNIY